MGLLIDLVVGLLAVLVASYVLNRLSVRDPINVVIAVLIGLAVFLAHPSGWFHF